MKIDSKTIVHPLPNHDLISQVEKSLKIQFPKEYKEFLLVNNGAVPITNKFTYNKHDYLIERFLCILENSDLDEINGWYDIEVIIAQVGERLTADEDLIGINIVPIAVLYASDFICLDFRELQNPCIVIWDHEESEEFFPVTRKIADNIGEFLLMLE